LKLLDSGICAIEGIHTWGIRKGKHGLAIIHAEAKAAAVYTQNKITAAPLQVTKKHLEQTGGQIKAIVINSGNANAYTGQQGIKDAEQTAETLAEKLNCKKEEVLVASTGIIGQPLNTDLIKKQIEEIIPKLKSNSTASRKAAEAIMTTDTHPKQFAVETEGSLRVGGIAKGAGMIAPNMATMLAFLTTNAALSPRQLQKCLKNAVDKSFNMTIVDGDTSTNDMAILISTGKKKCNTTQFQKTLDTVCIELAKMIARDGEGATKLIECTVSGAKTQQDARKTAHTILTSPLVKTAIFGEDPNWGRIIAAAGRSGAEIQPEKITLTLSNPHTSTTLIKNGQILPMAEKTKQIMKTDTLRIHLDLGVGEHSATGWGCDLTYNYIKINAEYTT
jgi:glutamate N-acetyltransferase/amino-acid N-acetyltransferase